MQKGDQLLESQEIHTLAWYALLCMSCREKSYLAVCTWDIPHKAQLAVRPQAVQSLACHKAVQLLHVVPLLVVSLLLLLLLLL